MKVAEIGNSQNVEAKRRGYSAHIWEAVRLNNKRCVNWTMAVGVLSVVMVSAATWIGVAELVSKLMH